MFHRNSLSFKYSLMSKDDHEYLSSITKRNISFYLRTVLYFTTLCYYFYHFIFENTNGTSFVHGRIN